MGSSQALIEHAHAQLSTVQLQVLREAALNALILPACPGLQNRTNALCSLCLDQLSIYARYWFSHAQGQCPVCRTS